MEYKRIPVNYRPIETSDGSLTLFSESFQEACHSSAGARAETLLHYIQGCQVVERSGAHSPFDVLEVGLGVGTGLLTTLEKFPPEHSLRYLSLELDRELLVWFQEEHPELGLTWTDNVLQGRSGNAQIDILCGDARETLPAFLKSLPAPSARTFHAIYQDAFSPRRNPSLWTVEWFNLLREASAPSVILSTYSASTSVRKSLVAAGWGVLRGEPFGAKRASTRAVLGQGTDPEIQQQLDRAPVLPRFDLQLDPPSPTIRE